MTYNINDIKTSATIGAIGGIGVTVVTVLGACAGASAIVCGLVTASLVVAASTIVCR